MYRDHTVGVVVPAYNESRFVGKVIETVPDYVDRIYAIDDGSTDDTWQEIVASANRVNDSLDDEERPFEERVVPIKHEQNRGVGGALKTGYGRAQADRVDVTAVMGGDGQMRPAELHRFLDPIVEGRAEYVKGNRLHSPETRADMPRFRLLGNYLLTLLTKVASGYWGIGDPQNGYTAISLSALDAIELDDLYEFYGYCNDLLVKLNVAGMRVADVTRRCNYADEESHIEYSTYIPRVSWMLFRNFWWRLRQQYVRGSLAPSGVCYVLGMLVSGLGTVLAGNEAVTGNQRKPGLVTPLTGVVGGLLLFVVGALLEHRANDDLAVQIWHDGPAEGVPEPDDTDDSRRDETAPDPADAGVRVE